MSLFQNSVQQKYLNQHIKTQIETTDQEIDKMVYALYELSDEEIKIKYHTTNGK